MEEGEVSGQAVEAAGTVMGVEGHTEVADTEVRRL